MTWKAVRSIQIAAVIIAGAFPWMLAGAQDSGADSLESQLAAKYKLVKLGTDSTGVAVLETGTVLVIKKGGIISVPTGNSVILPSTVKDGQVHASSNTVAQGVSKFMKWKGLSDPTGAASTDTKFLTVGEKVYVTKIDVNRKDSKVALTIIECDTCNNVQDASQRRGQVVFQFPKDYLNGADGGQVSDLINQTLEIQADDSGQQQQGQDAQGQQDAQAQQQQAPQQPAAPPQPPPTIQLGQTPDEVTGALGQPEKIVNLGAKQIYYYKDMKITFVKGKVSDVQ
ncbi:MAG TPA: hypothetical protein VFB10_05035 [Candidatus Dormibacteraeota bacterium]|nr:hypothetical protein [Candidatus Dormibacteraeota bacterium]